MAHRIALNVRVREGEREGIVRTQGWSLRGTSIYNVEWADRTREWVEEERLTVLESSLPVPVSLPRRKPPRCDACHQEITDGEMLELQRPVLRYWHKECSKPLSVTTRATLEEILAWYADRNITIRLCGESLQWKATGEVEPLTLDTLDLEKARITTLLRRAEAQR